jgi:hypothetical protein
MLAVYAINGVIGQPELQKSKNNIIKSQYLTSPINVIGFHCNKNITMDHKITTM